MGVSFRYALALAAALLLHAGTAGAQNKYGSIALSAKGTQYGYSTNHNSMQEAERAALAECGKRARDCEIFKSIENTCVSFAIARNAAAGWATGGDTAEARKKAALDECKRQGGDVCNYITDFCAR